MAFARSFWVRVGLAAVGALAVAGVAGFVAFYVVFLRDLPDLRSVADYRPPLSSHVLDREGREIGEFFVERRRLTALETVPPHVIHAFVAGEDSSFFEHEGIDFASILRAAWVNVRAGGEIRQGGSTITQQMVKGLLLSPEQTYRRKIREMILARRIEQRFSKEEILYLYLNQIYFGHGAYGIGEAARTYFGKHVFDLSVSEGALLAGLPKAPSRYSPHSNPDQAEARRLYVLERMLEDEFIDGATHDEAVAERPALAEWPPEAHADAAYFTEEVRRYLFDTLGGDAVLEGGLEVETTLDLALQRSATRAVRTGLEALDRRQGYRGPVRRVEKDEIEAEIDRLSEANGLAEPTPAPIFARRDQPEGDPGPLPGPGPWAGVVVSVDNADDSARVAFGSGVEGVVRLADVAWARQPDPSRAPHEVKSIRHVFARGDVAEFALLPPEDDDEGDADAPLRLTLHQAPIVEGALFSLDVASGEVLALVGGYDFARSQFDRVTQARRQPGSAFKPLIYGAALEKGYTGASILHDRPVVYEDETSGFIWRPQNYGRSFYGPIILREALARSINNATVHLFRDIGVDYVIGFARRLGIEAPLARDLSLALGSSGVSLLELTRAYATFPAGGRRVSAVFIRRVLDRGGETIVENVLLDRARDEHDGNGTAGEEVEAEEPAEAVSDVTTAAFEGDADPDPNQLLTREQAYLVTDLLRAVVVDPHGTGRRLRALRRPVAGKTGTTNDQGDAWFMGFSPDIATGVWVGHDESRFLGWGETGSRAAAPIWIEYMRSALSERPMRDFAVPDDIVFARIDRKTGLLADPSSEETVFQAFLADTEPTETATTATRSTEGRRLLRIDPF
jgi:penicillin-binding protein 1A